MKIELTIITTNVILKTCTYEINRINANILFHIRFVGTRGRKLCTTYYVQRPVTRGRDYLVPRISIHSNQPSLTAVNVSYTVLCMYGVRHIEILKYNTTPSITHTSILTYYSYSMTYISYDTTNRYVQVIRRTRKYLVSRRKPFQGCIFPHLKPPKFRETAPFPAVPKTFPYFPSLQEKQGIFVWGGGGQK